MCSVVSSNHGWSLNIFAAPAFAWLSICLLCITGLAGSIPPFDRMTIRALLKKNVEPKLFLTRQTTTFASFFPHLHHCFTICIVVHQCFTSVLQFSWISSMFHHGIHDVSERLLEFPPLFAMDFTIVHHFLLNFLASFAMFTWLFTVESTMFSPFSPWNHQGSAVAKLLRNVQQIKATTGACAALRSDGRVVAWRWPSRGGGESGGLLWKSNWYYQVFIVTVAIY